MERHLKRRQLSFYGRLRWFQAQRSETHNAVKSGPVCGTRFLLSLLKLSAKKPSQIHMWSVGEKGLEQFCMMIQNVRRKIEVFCAISYLVFYIFT